MNLDDEPEVTERHISVADAKALMSTPTETIAALNAYSLQLSRLKTKNIQPYTPTESTVACSPYDFHITYPRDEAMYDFFCERPASRPSPRSHFARVMNRLQIPHPLPPTDLVAPFMNDELQHAQLDDAEFLSDFPPTEHAVHLSSLSPDELENYLDPVRTASQRSPERSAPPSLTNLVDPPERDVLESIFCTDDPSDAFAKYYSFCLSLRNESVFLDTGPVSDEVFDDTSVNSARRNRIFFGFAKMRRSRE